jgi:hypothetical protein
MVSLPTMFAAGYAGTKNSYMYAAGSSAHSAWQPMGVKRRHMIGYEIRFVIR